MFKKRVSTMRSIVPSSRVVALVDCRPVRLPVNCLDETIKNLTKGYFVPIYIDLL